jgi:hypothetical protein
VLFSWHSTLRYRWNKKPTILGITFGIAYLVSPPRLIGLICTSRYHQMIYLTTHSIFSLESIVRVAMVEYKGLGTYLSFPICTHHIQRSSPVLKSTQNKSKPIVTATKHCIEGDLSTLTRNGLFTIYQPLLRDSSCRQGTNAWRKNLHHRTINQYSATSRRRSYQSVYQTASRTRSASQKVARGRKDTRTGSPGLLRGPSQFKLESYC